MLYLHRMGVSVLHTISDQELLKQITDGSQLAYKELFLKYYSPLCEFASQYLSDSDAEDVVQDLMVALWEERGSFNINSSVRSYLFSATKNRCINAILKNQYVERKRNIFYDEVKDMLDDPNFYLANELKTLIKQAIEKLPTDYRKVFVESRFGEKTNAQIAHDLGVSVKTVEYRITQSLKILRHQLGDYLAVALIVGFYI